MSATSKQVRLEAANGTPIKVYGEQSVQFRAAGKEACEMGFVITDVAKPLAAVSAITRAGNRVVFKPGTYGSYIENSVTGDEIDLVCENGTYTREVEVAGLEVVTDFARQG